MPDISSNLQDDGFLVVDAILTPRRCDEIANTLTAADGVGSRDLLKLPEVRRLAREIREFEPLHATLSAKVAVQCTSFIKSRAQNWAVRLHRDRAIPATGGNGWKSSGIKDEMNFIRPPESFLKKLIAVRLNIDDATEGDLQIIPGSHKHSLKGLRQNSISIPVSKGGALVMYPLLEHASTKLRNAFNRRVLHFVFGPADIPNGYYRGRQQLCQLLGASELNR